METLLFLKSLQVSTLILFHMQFARNINIAVLCLKNIKLIIDLIVLFPIFQICLMVLISTGQIIIITIIHWFMIDQNVITITTATSITIIENIIDLILVITIVQTIQIIVLVTMVIVQFNLIRVFLVQRLITGIVPLVREIFAGTSIKPQEGSH